MNYWMVKKDEWMWGGRIMDVHVWMMNQCTFRSTCANTCKWICTCTCSRSTILAYTCIVYFHCIKKIMIQFQIIWNLSDNVLYDWLFPHDWFTTNIHGDWLLYFVSHCGLLLFSKSWWLVVIFLSQHGFLLFAKSWWLFVIS